MTLTIDSILAPVRVYHDVMTHFLVQHHRDEDGVRVTEVHRPHSKCYI
jgi:hypothetical protein